MSNMSTIELGFYKATQEAVNLCLNTFAARNINEGDSTLVKCSGHNRKAHVVSNGNHSFTFLQEFHTVYSFSGYFYTQSDLLNMLLDDELRFKVTFNVESKEILISIDGYIKHKLLDATKLTIYTLDNTISQVDFLDSLVQKWAPLIKSDAAAG